MEALMGESNIANFQSSVNNSSDLADNTDTPIFQAGTDTTCAFSIGLEWLKSLSPKIGLICFRFLRGSGTDVLTFMQKFRVLFF
jgi:hypothetical protein